MKKQHLLRFLPAVVALVLVAGAAYATGTTNLESLRVGSASDGGVTFFNGSIVNEGGPVVIADDVRIDGTIYRLPDEDNRPVQIDDDLEVTGTITANYVPATTTLSVPVLDCGEEYPLTLPDGARISSFALSVTDNGVGYGQAKLFRKNDGGNVTLLAKVTSDGLSDSSEVRDLRNDSLDTTINNDANGVYVIPSWYQFSGGTCGTGAAVMGNMEITYTYTPPF